MLKDFPFDAIKNHKEPETNYKEQLQCKNPHDALKGTLLTEFSHCRKRSDKQECHHLKDALCPLDQLSHKFLKTIH